MELRKIILILALALTGPASADIVTLVKAVETVTSNVSVPTSDNGRLMFRPCAEECEEKFVIVRLTGDTTFFVRSQRVNFLDFRQAFYNMRRGDEDYALVSYDVEAKTVTSVSIGL